MVRLQIHSPHQDGNPFFLPTPHPLLFFYHVKLTDTYLNHKTYIQIISLGVKEGKKPVKILRNSQMLF